MNVLASKTQAGGLEGDEHGDQYIEIVYPSGSYLWANKVVADANDRVFFDETTLAPATAGEPTLAEVEAFALAGSYKDVMVFYTGTDTDTDDVINVYHIDQSGVATLITKPSAAPVPNAKILSGTVDVDALLADMEIGQAFHIATNGAVSLTSAGQFAEYKGGLASAGAVSPYLLPNDVVAFLTKTAGGFTQIWLSSDNSGTVAQWVSPIAFTTTNGATIQPGQWYHEYPDGTTAPAYAPVDDFDWAISTIDKVEETNASVVPNTPISQYTSTFTPDADGYYVLTHKADSVSGTGIIYVGTSAGASDVFDSLADRIDDTALEKNYAVLLEAGTEYFFSTQSGGGSTQTNPSFEITPVSIDESSEPVDSVIDLYEQLSGWGYVTTSAGQAVAPLRSEIQQGKNVVVVSDTGGGSWHRIESAENLPLTQIQRVLVEFAKIPADVTDPLNPILPPSIALRMSYSGVVRDLVINPDTGEVVRVDADIEVLSVVDSGDFIQVLVEYQPNPLYAEFAIFPAYGDNGAAGSNGSFQSELAISKLDMNYFGDAPAVEVDNRVLIMRQDVNTAAGLFTTAELTTDVNAGSADPSSEIKYRNLTLVTEDFKDVNGAITYELHYEEVSNNGGDDVIVRFSQTSDLTEVSATQLEIESNSVTTTQFVGLAQGDGTNSSFDGFNNTGFWWSIGIATLHAGAIPINQVGNIYGNIASLYIVPLTEEQKAIKAAAAYVDKPVSVVYEVEASAANSSGQPAGNGLFVIDNQVENVLFDNATFDAATSTWTFTAPLNYDLTVSTQDYETRGVTGDAVRVYHFRDVTTAVGDVLGAAGEFGQNSAHTPASFVLPAGETITVDIRSVTSGNNQILNARAKVIATVDASKEQLHAKPINYLEYQPTALEINEYINNMVPYHAVLAHEAAGANAKTVNVNGVAATFGNLQNATDNGSGVISFSGGTNGNFNRRGATVETITKVDEYIEVITAATGNFDTQMITLSPDASVLAESHTAVDGLGTEVLRLRLAGSGFTLLDGEGTTLASGGTENGTYRFTRTYFGWKVERNGVVIHESAEICVNYNEGSDVPISGNTGTYRVGVYEPAGREDIANTQFLTGFDLTQAGADQMHMRFTVSDTATGRQWPSQEVNVKPLLERFNAGDTVDTYVSLFDNDYLILNVNDPATGDLQITDNGRQFAIEKIELWIVGTETQALFELSNVGTVNTTATFQNIGDANPLIMSDDGAAVYIQYGDNNRDKFYFLDGLAKAERKGFGTNDLEFQVAAGGQLQVRDDNATSGIIRVWYEAPKRAILFNTVAGSEPSDTIPAFTSGLKTSFYDLDGRDVTVLTDSAGTTESVDRPYDNAAYPFVEIEYVKDPSATHGLIVRPNGTGGVQSQVRMSLVDDTNLLLSSGTGSVDATIVSIVETETTIKYMLDFSASTATFTELEISPTGTDAALAPSPAQTGSTGIVAVNLYESIPSYINDESASGYVDVGNTRIQYGEFVTTNIDGDQTVTLPASFGNTSYSVVTQSISGSAETSIADMFTVPTRNASNFVINRDDNIDGFTGTIMWQAIGIKP